jgi:hypothetical protein
VVVLLSSRSTTKHGFVNAEIAEALELLHEFPESSIYVIPVRLDECQPSHSVLRDLHWGRLFPSYEDGFAALMGSIRHGSREDVGKGQSEPRNKTPDNAIRGVDAARFPGYPRPSRLRKEYVVPTIVGMLIGALTIGAVMQRPRKIATGFPGVWTDGRLDVVVSEISNGFVVRYSDGRTATGHMTGPDDVFIDFRYTNSNRSKCCRALLTVDHSALAFPDPRWTLENRP